MPIRGIQSSPAEAPRGPVLPPSAPAEILDLPERKEAAELGRAPWAPPEFWPEGLDPMDNQNVSLWLLGEGPWEGQEPGWKCYALDSAEAAMKPGTWAWRCKRAMDLTLALLGLPLALPIMVLAGLAVYFTTGRPVHFRQRRPGYLGKPFKIYKLRTMVLEGNSESPSEDGRRLTFLGRFLRKSSIDELPQLFNVLKGEMSFVGPRPQLISYTPRFAYCSQRQGVLPGITGLAQISGRNKIDWEERTSLDLQYIKTQSLWDDWKILMSSLPRVFSGENISRNEECTMSEPVLMGNSPRRVD